jgi:hypothetical protein
VCIIRACWLVGNYLLLSDFGPYGVIFMNVCVIVMVAMAMWLGVFGPYGIVFDGGLIFVS